MILETDIIIDKYYESIKDKYPDITREELNIICRSPFKFLMEQMSKVTIPIIRFQYWGVYFIGEKRFNHVKRSIDKALQDDKITEEKYDKLKLMIGNHESRYKSS